MKEGGGGGKGMRNHRTAPPPRPSLRQRGNSGAPAAHRAGARYDGMLQREASGATAAFASSTFTPTALASRVPKSAFAM